MGQGCELPSVCRTFSLSHLFWNIPVCTRGSGIRVTRIICRVCCSVSQPGLLLPPRGHWAMSGDIGGGCHSGGAPGMEWVGAREVPRTAPENNWALNVSSAEV